MSKEITFDLSIRFSEKITSDDDFKEITENICNAIVRECDNYGITPDMSDIYVEWVGVRETSSNIRALKKLV